MERYVMNERNAKLAAEVIDIVLNIQEPGEVRYTDVARVFAKRPLATGLTYATVLNFTQFVIEGLMAGGAMDPPSGLTETVNAIIPPSDERVFVMKEAAR